MKKLLLMSVLCSMSIMGSVQAAVYFKNENRGVVVVGNYAGQNSKALAFGKIYKWDHIPTSKQEFAAFCVPRFVKKMDSLKAKIEDNVLITMTGASVASCHDITKHIKIQYNYKK